MKIKGIAAGLAICLTIVNCTPINVEAKTNLNYSQEKSMTVQADNSKDSCMPLNMAKYTANNGVIYGLYNDSAIVLGLKESIKSGKIKIADKIKYNNNTYTVDAIEEYAFANRGKVVVTYMPSTIVSIGDYAFFKSQFDGKLPDKLKTIGRCAFKNAKSLKNLTIPNSVTKLGEGAFWGSSVLTVNVSDALTYIPESAFRSAYRLNMVKLGKKTSKISGCAFFNCKKLTVISNGGNVKKVQTKAFAYSPNLRKPSLKAGASVASDAYENKLNTTIYTSNNEKEYEHIVYSDKRKSFIDYTGEALKSKLVKWNSKTFFADEKGYVFKGWKKVSNAYYYFDRSTGVMAKSKTVDGILIDKNGKASKTTYNVNKIECMIRAREIMKSITNESDSNYTKLKKCFDWIIPFPYYRHRILAQVRNEKGWEIPYAYDVFNDHNGCCVSYGSAMCFLAKECGYENVYLCDDTGHAWCEINGLVYDPLFAEAKSYWNYFGGTYSAAGLYRVNGLKY